MVDFYFPFIIFTLIIIVVIQAIERFYYSQHMQEEQSKLITAIMSKNIGEYTTARQVETQKPAIQQEPDEVELSQADNASFDKFIKEQTK